MRSFSGTAVSGVEFRDKYQLKLTTELVAFIHNMCSANKMPMLRQIEFEDLTGIGTYTVSDKQGAFANDILLDRFLFKLLSPESDIYGPPTGIYVVKHICAHEFRHIMQDLKRVPGVPLMPKLGQQNYDEYAASRELDADRFALITSTVSRKEVQFFLNNTGCIKVMNYPTT